MSAHPTEQLDEPISEANQEESAEEGLDEPPYEQGVYDDAYDVEDVGEAQPDMIDDDRLAEIQVLEHAQPKEALVMPTLPEREEIEMVRERAQQAAQDKEPESYDPLP